ncbi:digestive organ expansion factor [Electrophorus electricus]|uniref:U3 small nucleolar RNA-associated protein 25 homolog n=1 Tax=Electrophorus electricus TaxID=8005 RepID=A0A4W4HKN9_ELEEL|nr:digestive organ expansion factor [Electrophorus electricus]
MGKRKQKKQDLSSLTKKQKKHLKEFGEQHPFHDNVTERPEKTQVMRLPDSPVYSGADSDEDDEDEKPSAYERLLSTLNHAEQDSEDEESDGDDDDVEEEDLVSSNEEVDVAAQSEDEDEDGKVNGAPANSADEEPLEGRRKGVDEDFTDQVQEAEFCLETNLPEGEQEGLEKAEQCFEEDTFVKHQETELSEAEVKMISEGSKIKTQVKWPRLGTLQCVSTLERFPSMGQAPPMPLPPFHKALEPNWRSLNRSSQPGVDGPDLTDLQRELLRLMGSYRDVYFPECSPLTEGPEVRRVYCLHALNHILKANSRVLAHNVRLKEAKRAEEEEEEEIRDQGLTRPKVLILVPFRDSALRVVQTFIALLEPEGKKIDVSHKKRFRDEYGEEPTDRPPNLRRPDDYLAVFSGNVDDHFRIGMSILKRSLRLYSPFYSSDVIIASPLGLRTLLGAEGEPRRDFDFLSSIELLVVDQADVFLMQNWEHVLHVLKHMNLQPLDSHGVDFSRVRLWNLNNWAHHYRQTLMFSAVQEPQINNILSNHCHNYRGQVTTKNLPKVGSICQVTVQLPHVFHMFQADSFKDQDARFQFFVNKVLPQFRDSVMSHTLVYVPSYFDFVRLRNHLRKEDVSFACISEYSPRSEVSRARHFFQKGDKQLLIFSERFHFYKRYTIKGVHNLIFYALPTYAHFYSEVCNMLQTGTREGVAATSLTCTALYSRYDAHRLACVAGAERAAHMLRSEKAVHLFVTGEEKSA